MSKQFTLSILTPDKAFHNCMAEQIIFDSTNGRMGVMADHMPMVASVAEGTVDICEDGEWKTAALGRGFLEIGKNTAEFFVDSAEWAEDIDTARAIEALQRAEARMRSEQSRMEYLRTQAAMARAMARLKAAQRQSSGGEK